MNHRTNRSLICLVAATVVFGACQEKTKPAAPSPPNARTPRAADASRDAADLPIDLRMPESRVELPRLPKFVPGACGPSYFPSTLVTVLSPQQQTALSEAIAGWLQYDGATLDVEAKRGVLFAESMEDMASDPPYPASVSPESQLVCGTATEWLRAALAGETRNALADGNFACDGNRCCYQGMEYAPSGELLFGFVDRTVVLRGWAKVYSAALVPNVAAANELYVKRALLRLMRAQCKGETKGVLM